MTKTRSIISETIIGKDEPLQPFRSAMTRDTEDVVARQFERLIAVEKALANGSHFADDPECHQLYPQAVAARQTLQEHVQSLSDRIDVLEEALNAIIDGSARRHVKWSGMLAHDIARAALHQ